jgi:hypothetical protein
MHINLSEYKYIENQTKIIQNIHGQYWTGTTWGAKEAAAEFHPGDFLPEIPGLELEVGGYWYLPDEDEPFAGMVRK